MNRTKLIIIFIIFTLIISGGLLLTQAKKKAPCCIAGTYNGWNEDTPSASCNEPEKGKFKLYLYQEKGCGENIFGKVVNSSGDINEFKGKVFPGPGKCCTFKCQTLPSAATSDIITFKAVLCSTAGKWKSKNGEYKNSSGCFGKFEITQI